MTRQTNDMTAGVVTGEAVELDIRLARWPSRLLGQLIDLVIEFTVFGVLGIVITKLTHNADSDAGAAIFVALFVTVFFGYPVALETLWGGRSLGKAALGIRVVRDDGAPERFRQALFRALMFVLVDWWGPGLIVSVLNGSSKRIGDLVAGTIVVQDRMPGGSIQPIAMPLQLSWWAASLDLQRLDDELALACRQFLYRQAQMHPGAREQLGAQLVAAVSARVWPPPPPGTPGWAYLAAVLAERRRRATPQAAFPPPAFQQPGLQPPAFQPPPASQQVAPQPAWYLQPAAPAPASAPTLAPALAPAPAVQLPAEPPATAPGPFAPPA
jgi:uncharacterized RDD family membrane protein YckC